MLTWIGETIMKISFHTVASKFSKPQKFLHDFFCKNIPQNLYSQKKKKNSPTVH